MRGRLTVGHIPLEDVIGVRIPAPQSSLKIAKNIKKYRKERGLSQDKLSRLADVSHATIIKIESGGIQSSIIDTVQKIAKALGVSLEDLTK